MDCYSILVETDKLNEQLAIKKLGEFIKLLTKVPPLKLEPKSLTRLLFFQNSESYFGLTFNNTLV